MVDWLNGQARRIPVWLIYTGGMLPSVWLVWLAVTGALSVEPIKALEHELGLIALQLVIAGLAITPARRFVGLNLIRFRRAVGLLAFYYVSLHLLVWLVLDVQILSQVWADIVKRPYITIGMAGFAMMIPLALTSNNRAVRWLGPRWRVLHRMTYGVAILGGVHFVMLTKGFQIEPLVYLGVVLLLLALRLPVFQRKAIVTTARVRTASGHHS